ncbi:STAS domain-containing protein [Streptomyces sp. A1136]|uniref:STAS domain-containing protein n=1 Tax=Streptomyces sp. A1136 TaxID=2563102 RepID=UPI00109E61E8|nr:STAS domain-containing protein [Streptomyces sp. A1136]THA44805.1 anti-sigma factor antagonist [Streptomyces sp. A1136]
MTEHSAEPAAGGLHRRTRDGDGTLTADVTHTHDRLAVITLSGRLDGISGWQLRGVIGYCLARDLTVLILDVHALETCDEAGLHVLTGASAGCTAMGGAVHLAAPAPRLRAMLTAEGLERFLPLHDDLEAALRAVPQPPVGTDDSVTNGAE